MNCWRWWWTMPSGFSGHEEGAMRRVWFGKGVDRFALRRAVGKHSRLMRHVGRVSPRRATYFFVARQRSRQESVPRCRAPFGGSLLPAMPGGVFANSPFGLKHAKPFFRPSSPPVGTSEGTGKAGDQRSVPTDLSAGARCIRKARSDPPSSTPAGGAFRCGCLSRRSRRVPHRPPAGSSAGQSAAGRPVRRVAFFAFFLGDARKKVARRGETRPMQLIYPESLAVKALSFLSPGALASPLPT